MSGATLRPWRSTDAADLRAAYLRSPDLGLQFGEADLSDAEQTERFIAEQLAGNHSNAHFALCLGDRAVGNVGLGQIERRHQTGWVHYWLATEARGKGLATAGVAAVAAWAFEVVGLFRLELGHRVDNAASCRVATRTGFRAEGVQRSKLAYGDLRFDVETHARLATDPTPELDLLPLQVERGE